MNCITIDKDMFMAVACACDGDNLNSLNAVYIEMADNGTIDLYATGGKALHHANVPCVYDDMYVYDSVDEFHSIAIPMDVAKDMVTKKCEDLKIALYSAKDGVYDNEVVYSGALVTSKGMRKFEYTYCNTVVGKYNAMKSMVSDTPEKYNGLFSVSIKSIMKAMKAAEIVSDRMDVATFISEAPKKPLLIKPNITYKYGYDCVFEALIETE